jgi:tetratricopeptide (TPR) repeat protein
MVVEDLQHADDGFLDFIEHLLDWTRDLPIFVLTFARPELESRRPGWGTGRRNSTALTLDPLDAAAMRLLLDGLVPDMPTAAQTAIAGRAEGIPLYAVETVRMLIDRDVVQPVDGVYRLVGDLGELTVPATLKSLLAARLDALDADARALIADAAVLGGSFPVEALVAVSGQSEDHVRAQVAELVRREVLGVRADPLSPQRGQYAFVQTIFRQVAYDTLSRRERKARHLAVAAHLRNAFADDGEEVVEVIATHLVDAINAVPDDPDVPELQPQAVDALLRAADRATRTGAPAAAARTFLTAAELLERRGDDADLAAAELRERAGAVLVTANDVDAAEREYRLALDTYRRHGDARATARAQTEVGAVLRREGRLDDARKQLTEAVQVLKSEPDRAYVHALAEQATLEAFAGNADDADALSAAALAEAQALGLPEDGYPDLFVIRGLAHGRGSRPMQAAANFREVVRLGQESGHSLAAARALLNLGDVLMSIDPVAAAKASRSARDLCRRTGARYLLGTVVANLIQSLLLTGDWDEAREVYASALADDDLVDDLPTAWGSVMLLAFSGERDQLAAATRVFPAESEDPQDGSTAATARAAGAVLDGHWSDAQRYANEALSFASALGLHADTIRWSWPIAADAALELHDTAEAVRLVELLESHRPGHVPAVLHAERKRIEARLLAAASDPGAAPAFERAVDGFRQLASPYHLAVCLLDAADHRLASDDPDGALQYAREAGGIASRLGADPLAKRAERLIEEPVVQASAAEATVS